MPTRKAAVLAFILLSLSVSSHAEDRWSATRATAWYATQPWLVGSNFTPSSASNQLEMWQPSTFDPAAIDRELGFAEGIGMNTMRVFLHDLLWADDPSGLIHRIGEFLTLAEKHHMRILFVLFDSCWDPHPHLGQQPSPVPGRHNSRWVQSPGADALADRAQIPRLRDYVQGVIGAFAKDPRVLGWDLWNEPDNLNAGAYGSTELKDKLDRVTELLPKAFDWARAAHPTQPLTSGISEVPIFSGFSDINRIQIEQSDVISFHSYDGPFAFRRAISRLKNFGRPILCTEYMARPKSTFQKILPVAEKAQVAAYNWGLVAGKTQTNLSWGTWAHPALGEPKTWFHDVFRADGTPYDANEVDFIRALLRP